MSEAQNHPDDLAAHSTHVIFVLLFTYSRIKVVKNMVNGGISMNCIYQDLSEKSMILVVLWNSQ